MSDVNALTTEQKAAIKELLLVEYFTSDANTRAFLANYLKRRPIDERESLKPTPEAIEDLEKILQS